MDDVLFEAMSEEEGRAGEWTVTFRQALPTIPHGAKPTTHELVLVIHNGQRNRTFIGNPREKRYRLVEA